MNSWEYTAIPPVSLNGVVIRHLVEYMGRYDALTFIDIASPFAGKFDTWAIRPSVIIRKHSAVSNVSTSIRFSVC